MTPEPAPLVTWEPNQKLLVVISEVTMATTEGTVFSATCSLVSPAAAAVLPSAVVPATLSRTTTRSMRNVPGAFRFLFTLKRKRRAAA